MPLLLLSVTFLFTAVPHVSTQHVGEAHVLQDPLRQKQ
jgi:hypothetical protein